MAKEFEFLDTSFLNDGSIYLSLYGTSPGDEASGLVPAYDFYVCDAKTKTKMAEITLRVGYNERIYYGGNIKYIVYARYRGNHLAVKGCRLLLPLAAKHGMEKLILTSDPDNKAAKRTCELLGAKLTCTADIPPHIDMYLEGKRRKCIYELEIPRSTFPG